MAMFKGKACEVEALRFDGTRESIASFIDSSYAFGNILPDSDGKMVVPVMTGRGTLRAYPGDWVVQHRFGFTAYAPDVFDLFYSPE